MTNYEKACAAYREACIAHVQVKADWEYGRIDQDTYTASIRRCEKAAGWCDAAEDAELRAERAAT
jgi:hypothetical protein